MSRRSRARKNRRQGAEASGRSSPDSGASVSALPQPAGLTPTSDAAYDAANVAKSQSQQSSKSLNFGEMLRRERELRRITLREVNEATKINIRYLEALERNDFEYLPAGAFAKGFIRSYARYIGLDETEMVNAYLYELDKQREETEEADPQRAMDSDMQASLQRHFGVETAKTARKRRRARFVIVLAGLLVITAIATAATLFVLHQTRASDDEVGLAITAPHQSSLP